MGEVTRRTLLTGAGLGAAALSLPAFAKGAQRPALAVFDSRLSQSAAFASECRAAGIRLHDIAGEDVNLWRASRAGFGLAEGEPMVGMVGWSDWLVLRGLLHEQRRRITSETRSAADGRALFSWAAA